MEDYSEEIPRYSKHGLIEHPLYTKWQGLKTRCSNEYATGYINYGGRGISYCAEWESFENFYNWAIKNGYRKGLTLDRINNDGNYEPSNCRFTTCKVQANNRREYKKKDSLRQFCKDNGLLRYYGSVLMHLNNGKTKEWILHKYQFVRDVI
jgi:hypothetical protein